MSNGNHVSITGNITRDPELRFTPTGQAIANFGWPSTGGGRTG